MSKNNLLCHLFFCVLCLGLFPFDMEVLTLGKTGTKLIEMFLLGVDLKDLKKINRKHIEVISRSHCIHDLVPIGAHVCFYPCTHKHILYTTLLLVALLNYLVKGQI